MSSLAFGPKWYSISPVCVILTQYCLFV
jgi:hypothetical protein